MTLALATLARSPQTRLGFALLVALAGGCADLEVSSPEAANADGGLDGIDTDFDDVGDESLEEDLGVNIEELSRSAPFATRRTYGTTPRGRSLVYFEITPPNPDGRKAFLTFALHGFEDAWRQDGRALFSIAHKAINYYGNNPEHLQGWTLYIVPTGNPDGMHAGVNNWREPATGAFGRCTSNSRDINRNMGSGTSKEQRRLRILFDQIQPTIALDFHGWYNTYYGNSRLGGFFARSFNGSYEGKPARYCFVASNGNIDCGDTLGGIFHSHSTISHGLFAEWATRERGVPAALIEYPAPDYNLNGRFDTVWDSERGYRRIRHRTRNLMWRRTRVALNRLFRNY